MNKEDLLIIGSVVLLIITLYFLSTLTISRREECENNGGKFIDGYGIYDTCFYE